MAAFFTLLLLCLIMGFASFGAGLAPLVLNLSTTKIRLISSFGIGILVGTALIVIIPEGVEALYSSSEDESGNSKAIGISLILGFLMMFLIDRLPDYLSKRKSMPKFMSVGIDMSSLRFSHSNNDDTVSTNDNGSNNNKTPFSTIVGLVIHSIADGVALGASVASENSALEAIIFLAIMVHKAPASFGFSAVLLRDKVQIRFMKRALAVFASGAPLGALVTFLILKLIGSETNDIQQWTGLLLLFSGGTFLFVAVHAMQDLHESSDPGSLPQDSTGVDITLSAVGMLVPLVTLLVPDV